MTLLVNISTLVANSEIRTEVVEGMKARKARKVEAEIFGGYLTVLQAADESVALEAIRACGEIYTRRKRRTDSIPMEGFGQDNELALDYRLAALIHLRWPGLRDQLLAEGFVHVWRW